MSVSSKLRELAKRIDDGATADEIRVSFMALQIEAEALENENAKLQDAQDKWQAREAKRSAFVRHAVVSSHESKSEAVRIQTSPSSLAPKESVKKKQKEMEDVAIPPKET